MKQNKCLIKILVIGAIFLLILPSIQGAIQENGIQEQNKVEKNDIEPQTTETFNNCIVLIFGSCNSVGGAVTWLLGLYIPLFKKHITIGAGGEKLSAIVIGDGFGVYVSIENLIIDMWGTRGVLFWGGKSLLVESKNIIGICRAETCTVIS